MKNELLRVYLWDKEVGCLRWDDRKAVAYFVFSQEFLSVGLNLFPIIAPTDNAKTYIPIVGDKRKIYCGLPPFIADSLPDNWGSLVFEQWIKSKGLKPSSITPLDKLAYIGRRGMGALEYRPESERKDNKGSIMVGELANLAEKIYSQRESVLIDAGESLTLQSLFEVGTSAGGRQPKALVAINSETGEIRSGQIANLEGFEYHILKFAIHDDYPATEMEMTYYELALKAGMKMMPSSLLHIDGEYHFLTKRFDRKDGRKVFTQTLAAIDPEAESYETLFRTCRKLNIPENEIRDLFRQMAFNFLAANTDDHNKNFSFIMDETGNWFLSPPYDITFTADLRNPGIRHLHCLSVRGKLDGVTAEDLKSFARDMCIKNSAEIIDNVCSAICAFRETAMRNEVPLTWIDRIEEHLYSLAPEQYRGGLSGWKPAEVSSVLSGHKVEEIHFEMSASGNIHLCARVDGEERKYVFNQKRREFAEILRKGFNTMPDVEKVRYAARFLITS